MRQVFGLQRGDSWLVWLRQFFCFQCGGFDLDEPMKWCEKCGNGPDGVD